VEISGERSNGFRAIAFDHVSLVERVQASINLIEAAIARALNPTFVDKDFLAPQKSRLRRVA
jgi:hypothetical protein